MVRDFENTLRSDHDELDTLLHGIFGSLNAADFEGTFRGLDVFWARLAVHIRAEHLHLFPAISGLWSADPQFAELPVLIATLRRDHDHFMKELASLVKLMRAAESNKPHVLKEAHETLTALKGRLVEHNRIEEERLYNAGRLFSGGVENISASIQAELNNLPPRLNTLPTKE